MESVVSEDPLGKVIFFGKLAEERPHRTRRIPPERLPSNHRSEWEKIILKSLCCVAYFLCKGIRDWVCFPVFLGDLAHFSLIIFSMYIYFQIGKDEI